MVFKEIVRGIIRREGGYVDHPSDPGGETKYGIAKRSHPKENIKSLTKKRAEEIYYDKYWVPSKAPYVPHDIQTTFFDMVVNMGQRRAVKILQKACNSKNCGLVVDGLIGRNTLAAAKKIDVSRLKVFRILFYTDLIKRKPSLEAFIVGWIRRAMEA
jgi:lysozyme family protein|tara:strand:- start:1102 stop:1572 length:471 start_codon:yes stop_codon:yes gene_type:complete